MHAYYLILLILVLICIAIAYFSQAEVADGTSTAFVDVQLKGAGKTPYSRHADGAAVLRSSLREF